MTDITLNVTISSAVFISVINEDAKLIFDGAGGDTFLVYNSSNNKLELFVDGVKKQAWGN